MAQNYIRAYKQRTWIRTENNLENESNPSKFWRHFNRLIGKSSTPKFSILTGDSVTYIDADKANIFADSLQSVFTPKTTYHPVTRTLQTIEGRNDPHQPHLQISTYHALDETQPLTTQITAEEIIDVTKHKKNTLLRGLIV